jgi:hypothetical protein
MTTRRSDTSEPLIDEERRDREWQRSNGAEYFYSSETRLEGHST